MSSWCELVKKSADVNSVAYSIKTSRENEVEDDETIIQYNTFGLKNEDEEFDYKYGDNLTTIIVEFNDVLHSYGIEVSNMKLSSKLYDYTKYNSYNYDEMIEEVDKYNDLLEKEYDEELEEEEYY
jgi:hypothetical protein